MLEEVLRGLQPVGCTYGYREPQTTTFSDAGRIPTTSPLRAAYAHIEPTIFGFLGASLRLLRMPQVVYGLGQVLGARSLVEHLLGVYGINLAAIFGDNSTANMTRDIMFKTHMRRFPGLGQPDWLAEALGSRWDIKIGDIVLRTATTAVLASGAARAHQVTKVLADGHGEQYCRDLDSTIGFTTDLRLGATGPMGLHSLSAVCPGVPLMNHGLVAAAGVPVLLEQVLATELAPGVPISEFAPIIKGFMWTEDRHVLGLEQSSMDVAAFDTWMENYIRKNAAPNSGELSELRFFTVASRTES